MPKQTGAWGTWGMAGSDPQSPAAEGGAAPTSAVGAAAAAAAAAEAAPREDEAAAPHSVAPTADGGAHHAQAAGCEDAAAHADAAAPAGLCAWPCAARHCPMRTPPASRLKVDSFPFAHPAAAPTASAASVPAAPADDAEMSAAGVELPSLSAEAPACSAGGGRGADGGQDEAREAPCPAAAPAGDVDMAEAGAETRGACAQMSTREPSASVLPVSGVDSALGGSQEDRQGSPGGSAALQLEASAGDTPVAAEPEAEAGTLIDDAPTAALAVGDGTPTDGVAEPAQSAELGDDLTQAALDFMEPDDDLPVSVPTGQLLIDEQQQTENERKVLL